MRRGDVQFNFRMPADLKERLTDISRKNNRSLTAEMLLRLEESIAREDAAADPEDKLYDELKQIATEAMLAGSQAFFERAMTDDKPDVPAAQRDMGAAIERVFNQSKASRFLDRIHEPNDKDYHKEPS